MFENKFRNSKKMWQRVGTKLSNTLCEHNKSETRFVTEIRCVDLGKSVIGICHEKNNTFICLGDGNVSKQLTSGELFAGMAIKKKQEDTGD